MPAGDFENGILPVQHLEQAIQDGAIALISGLRKASFSPQVLICGLAAKHGGCKPAFCQASI